MENNNTKQKLIDATYEEIYKNGYQGASLSKILNTASVKKGSMYHFFSNKKEMALYSIEEKLNEKFSQRYKSILELENSYLEALVNELKDTSSRNLNGGCPIANIVQEMSNLDLEFKIMMENIYYAFRKNIIDILELAILKNEMKKSNTEKLALYIISTLEGAILSAKATGNKQDYLDVIDILSQYILSFKN